MTPEGLKAVFKDFNYSGDDLVRQLQTFRKHGVHVLGSFIFGLPTDNQDTFAATATLAQQAGIAFAQFVMLTPFPGTVDFERWEKNQKGSIREAGGVPVTRYWLIPSHHRPKMLMPHPSMNAEEIRERTQEVWNRFYSLRFVWKRSQCVSSLRSRLAFLFISKLYRQMYANTGMSTDSARKSRANFVARWLAKPCLRLFQAKPMPNLEIPRKTAHFAESPFTIFEETASR